MAAVTQIRHRHSDGRAYYDRKIAEGKTPKEALRSLKRRVSDAIYRHLQADARRAAAAQAGGPGGQPGNNSVASRRALTPGTGSSAKPLPDPEPPYGPLPSASTPSARNRLESLQRPLDAKKLRSGRAGTSEVPTRHWYPDGIFGTARDGLPSAASGLQYRRRGLLARQENTRLLTQASTGI